MLRWFLRVKQVISSGIAESSLMIMRVLSCSGGAAGVLVVLLAGLECLMTFLIATFDQVCWKATAGGGTRAGRPGGRIRAGGGGRAEREEPAGGGAGAADRMMLRRDNLSSSTTLVVRWLGSPQELRRCARW